MRALTVLPLLAASLTIPALAGCATIQPSTATEAAIVARICNEAWLPITLSRKDSEQTQAEVRAGNRARAEFCR